MLAELAATQWGVVARRQLAARGMTADEIKLRVGARRLVRLHRGVYAVGHRVLRREAYYLAAVLAVGDGAALSHRAAADLLGLRRADITKIDVTVAKRGARSRPGLTVHGVRRLHPDDVTLEPGIATTTWARTILDLADVLPTRQVERALDEAVVKRLYDERALRETIERADGRPVAGILDAILATHTAGTTWTRSALEEAGLQLAREAKLPPPEVNAHIEGFEVDLLWRDRRLVVELDGHAFHATPAARRRDREKERALRRAGLEVLRFDWHDVTADGASTARTLRTHTSADG